MTFSCDSFASDLEDYVSKFPDESEKIAACQELLLQDSCNHEHNFCPGHFVGSAFLLSPDCSEVLLTLHRKLGMWLQLGGHIEGQESPFDAAYREAHEESGIPLDLIEPVNQQILDIDIHNFPAREGRNPLHKHFDIRYVFIANSKEFKVSPESVDLRWVALCDLERQGCNETMLRMRDKLEDFLRIS